VALQRGTLAQVIVQEHAGVVDQDVERVDLFGGRLDLRPGWSRPGSGA
jgi:hypothetical protein